MSQSWYEWDLLYWDDAFTDIRCMLTVNVPRSLRNQTYMAKLNKSFHFSMHSPLHCWDQMHYLDVLSEEIHDVCQPSIPLCHIGIIPIWMSLIEASHTRTRGHLHTCDQLQPNVFVSPKICDVCPPSIPSCYIGIISIWRHWLTPYLQAYIKTIMLCFWCTLLRWCHHRSMMYAHRQCP